MKPNQITAIVLCVTLLKVGLSAIPIKEVRAHHPVGVGRRKPATRAAPGWMRGYG